MPSLVDIGGKIMTRTHQALFDASRGRILGTTFGMPVVKLETTGRKTGQRRATMLTAPVWDDKKVVLVASKGGYDKHPVWYLNLQAQPKVTVTMLGRTRGMVARTASAAEKAELWPQIVSAYKGYAGYQKRTDRDIPVVILEPA
jgi:deazaflavin-dependent oxidoreductase (nitroreductase family)